MAEAFGFLQQDSESLIDVHCDIYVHRVFSHPASSLNFCTQKIDPFTLFVFLFGMFDL